MPFGFPWFFSFVLFTKFSLKINGGGNIECLTCGDIKKDNKKNAGRSAEIKAMLVMKNEERIIDLTGDREISLQNKLMMKSIAIQERQSNTRPKSILYWTDLKQLQLLKKWRWHWKL